MGKVRGYSYHIYDYNNPNGTEVLIMYAGVKYRLIKGDRAVELAENIRDLDCQDDFNGIQALLNKY